MGSTPDDVHDIIFHEMSIISSCLSPIRTRCQYPFCNSPRGRPSICRPLYAKNNLLR